MAVDSAGTFNRLHRTCKLVVLLCLLHISITVVFYIRSMDKPFAFAQNQQTRNASALPDRLTHQKPLTEAEATPLGPQQPEPGPEEQQEKLEKCPDTSPLLGESHFRSSHTHLHTVWGGWSVITVSV